MSFLGDEIRAIAREHGILPVISIGNRRPRGTDQLCARPTARRLSQSADETTQGMVSWAVPAACRYVALGRTACSSQTCRGSRACA